MHNFDHIISLENLFAAWDEFLRGKRQRHDVMVFSVHVEDHLFELHRQLADGTWRHGAYMRFTVCDPKPRVIHKASVRDRILHHAIVRVIEPLFDTSFVYDSWSCRKEKGTYHAVLRCHQELERLYRNYRGDVWVLKCDIKKYFESIDHEILLAILAKRIKDPRTLMLLEEVIQSFSVGVPLGNLTSQLFANIYLNAFDHFAKEKLRAPAYLRYSDDIFLVHHSREWLEECIEPIRGYLHDTRKLTLHPNKIRLRPFHHGMDCLGYVLYPGYRVIRARTRRRLWRQIRATVKEYLTGAQSWASLTSVFASYDGILKAGRNETDRKKLELLRNCL